MLDQKVLAILGPTGVGKTNLAIQLQQNTPKPIEIISVDAVMVYKDCTIGCAKPNQEELNAAPHHLINICSHDEVYDVHRFLQDVQSCIQKIQAKGHIPCLVGGSMMYFYAAKEGIAKIPPISSEIREKIQLEARNKGWPAMWKELKSIDPQSAKKIECNDSQRIERALSVYRALHKPLSSFWQSGQEKPLANEHWQWLALYPASRSSLYQSLNDRFDTMLEQGFLDEVANIRNKSTPAAPGIRRAVGYRQIWDYLDGLIDKETMIEKGKTATRRLAKRQLTWMNNQFQYASHVVRDVSRDKKALSQAIELFFNTI